MLILVTSSHGDYNRAVFLRGNHENPVLWTSDVGLMNEVQLISNPRRLRKHQEIFTYYGEDAASRNPLIPASAFFASVLDLAAVAAESGPTTRNCSNVRTCVFFCHAHIPVSAEYRLQGESLRRNVILNNAKY